MTTVQTVRVPKRIRRLSVCPEQNANNICKARGSCDHLGEEGVSGVPLAVALCANTANLGCPHSRRARGRGGEKEGSSCVGLVLSTRTGSVVFWLGFVKLARFPGADPTRRSSNSLGVTDGPCFRAFFFGISSRVDGKLRFLGLTCGRRER